MSWLGLRSPALGSRGRCLLAGTKSIGGESTSTSLRQPFRPATTAAKPKAKKTASLSAESVSGTKKTLSTRSSTTAKFSKKDTKAARPETVAEKTTKPARAASTTTSSPKPPTLIQTPPSPAKVSPATVSSRPQPSAPAGNPKAEAQSGTKQPVDMKSPEYKRAYRQYTATLVAIPFLIVTSYYLYQRLVPGIGQKSLPSTPARPLTSQQDQASSS